MHARLRWVSIIALMTPRHGHLGLALRHSGLSTGTHHHLGRAPRLSTRTPSSRPSTIWTCSAGAAASGDDSNVVIKENVAVAGLKLRAARASDLPACATLCINTFRGPFEWWQKLYQMQQEFIFLSNLRLRQDLIRKKKLEHAMVVAQDTDSGELVGFMEIGMLPPPPSEQKVMEEDSSGGKPKYVPLPGERLRRDDDVPYLANIVVDSAQRRRGIGRALVSAGELLAKKLWVEKHEALYIKVERENTAAVALYTGIGFVVVDQEDEMVAARQSRVPLLYLKKSMGAGALPGENQPPPPQ